MTEPEAETLAARINTAWNIGHAEVWQFGTVPDLDWGVRLTIKDAASGDWLFPPIQKVPA